MAVGSVNYCATGTGMAVGSAQMISIMVVDPVVGLLVAVATDKMMFSKAIERCERAGVPGS